MRHATPRRVLCSIGAGPHEELLGYAAPTFEDYAQRHDYEVVLETKVVGLGARPVSWAKLALIRDLLDEHEVVVWIDADAVIVDPTDDIARPGRAPIDLVSHRVDGADVPNAGVMVVRRSPAAVRLIERVWERTEYLHHRWWENAALIAAIGGDPDVGLRSRRERLRARRWIGSLDHRWNSIPPCPAPDPAIVHLAGVGHAERVATMRRLVGSRLSQD